MNENLRTSLIQQCKGSRAQILAPIVAAGQIVRPVLQHPIQTEVFVFHDDALVRSELAESGQIGTLLIGVLDQYLIGVCNMRRVRIG